MFKKERIIVYPILLLLVFLLVSPCSKKDSPSPTPSEEIPILVDTTTLTTKTMNNPPPDTVVKTKIVRQTKTITVKDTIEIQRILRENKALEIKYNKVLADFQKLMEQDGEVAIDVINTMDEMIPTRDTTDNDQYTLTTETWSFYPLISSSHSLLLKPRPPLEPTISIQKQPYTKWLALKGGALYDQENLLYSAGFQYGYKRFTFEPMLLLDQQFNSVGGQVVLGYVVFRK